MTTERKIRNSLLEAHSWNAFSNPEDALRDVLSNEEYPADQIIAMHEQMVEKNIYKGFENAYWQLMKDLEP